MLLSFGEADWPSRSHFKDKPNCWMDKGKRRLLSDIPGGGAVCVQKSGPNTHVVKGWTKQRCGWDNGMNREKPIPMTGIGLSRFGELGRL